MARKIFHVSKFWIPQDVKSQLWRPPRLGNVPHFHFSSQALNHLTEGPIREAPLTNMLRCQATAQEAAERSQNYVNRAGDRAKTGATITPNVLISAFFRRLADESCFESGFIKEWWAHLKKGLSSANSGRNQTLLILSHVAALNINYRTFCFVKLPLLAPRCMTLSPRYLRSDLIHSNSNTSHLLRQCVCFHSYLTSSSGTIYPKPLDTSLSPLCLSNYVSTNTANTATGAPTVAAPLLVGALGTPVLTAPLPKWAWWFRDNAAPIDGSQHTHTPARTRLTSEPASRRFIVQHQRINFPELCRLVSTKLFSWLHPLCNLWVSQGAVWRCTWKSYNNKICSSLR